MIKGFRQMKIEAISWNIGKVFQSQSWYQRTLFPLMQEATEKQPLWEKIYILKIISIFFQA